MRTRHTRRRRAPKRQACIRRNGDDQARPSRAPSPGASSEAQLRLVLGQGPRRATEAPGGAQLGEAVMSGCSQTNDEHTNAGDIDGPPANGRGESPKSSPHHQAVIGGGL